MNHSSYLNSIIDRKRRSETVATAEKKLRRLGMRQFDAVVASGLSGTLVSAAIADRTKKGLVIVRKKGEECHGREIESDCPTWRKIRYFIIDDCIDSGATVDRIKSAIEKEYVESGCVGIILHSTSRRRNAYLDIPVYCLDDA